MEAQAAKKANMQELQAGLERLERREWWRWGTAIVIMLLLTLGVFLLAMPAVRRDAFTQPQVDVAVRGLLGLVLLFDIFAVYQQVQITRLRRQLASQIGMMAALEVLQPLSDDEARGRKERRTAMRYFFDQRLRLKTTLDGKEVMLHGRIRDLSERGLGAVIPQSVPVGSEVVLEFSLDEVQLALRAVVRHGRGFHHGFEFSAPASAEIEAIKRACQAGQRSLTATNQ